MNNQIIHIGDIPVGRQMVGDSYSPLLIAEIGGNHGGDPQLAKTMVRAAADAGARIVKFQCHIIDDKYGEMAPAAKQTIPGNSTRSIWDIMRQWELSEEAERDIKAYTESLGLFYLSTPFSRAAVDRLLRLGVRAFKVGSGELTNYPLVDYIARHRLPMIVSTGMSTGGDVDAAVRIIRKHRTPYALLHCVSEYPVAMENVNLAQMDVLAERYKDAVVGYSDHMVGTAACKAAIARDAAIVEFHFTSDKTLPGEDIEISKDSADLRELITFAGMISKLIGSRMPRTVSGHERVTAEFAHASVAAIAPIKKGDLFTEHNIWPKRPGTGEISARSYDNVLCRRARRDVAEGELLKQDDVHWGMADIYG